MKSIKKRQHGISQVTLFIILKNVKYKNITVNEKIMLNYI